MKIYAIVVLMLAGMTHLPSFAQLTDSDVRDIIKKTVREGQEIERQCRLQFTDPQQVRNCTPQEIERRQKANRPESGARTINGYLVVQLMNNFDLMIDDKFAARFYSWEQAEALVNRLPKGPN